MKQNWLCKSCGSQFIENPKKRGLDDRDKELVGNMLKERISIRGIARVLNVSRNCLRKYIKTVGAQAPEPEETLNKDEIDFEHDDIEIDEIWTYIGRRKKEHYIYIFVAIHRISRQVLAFQVGRRDVDTIALLWEKLNGLGVKGPVHTDELRAFYKVIPKSQHIDDGKRGGTSVVEGLNTRWRARCSRLVRRSVSCSKFLSPLVTAFKIAVATWNLSLQ